LLDSYAGGEPSAPEVDRHVRTCPDCRETVAALRRVRADLARLAGVTMPADVAERIHAVLAASHEGTRPSTSAQTTPAKPDAAPGPPHHATAPPGRPRPTRRPPAGHASRPVRSGRGGGRAGGRRDWLAVAAACLAIVAFGTVLLIYRHANDVGPTSTALAPANGADRAASGAGAAATEPPAAETAGVLVADSGRPVDAGTVGQHGRDLLAGRIQTVGRISVEPSSTTAKPAAPVPGLAAGPELPSGSAGQPPTPGRADANSATGYVLSAFDTPELRMCYLSLAAQTGGAVLAVDRIGYHGQPALLVVVSIMTRPDRVRVTVIDIRCGVTSMSAALWYSVTASRT
jgi:hypothetical protein